MTENERKLLHRVERNLFIDDLRHRATRQGRFNAKMWHLDHPVPGTDRLLQPSDDGYGAARIRDNCEPTPLWFILWQNAYAKLDPKSKRILRALMVDWRTRPAAKIASVSQPTVDRWKTFFKVHFAQCFRAWKRDFDH